MDYMWWVQAQAQTHHVKLLSILLVVCASVDSVLFLRLIKQMSIYVLPLSQIVYPVTFAMATFLISLVWYRDRIFCLAGIKRWRMPHQEFRYEMDEQGEPIRLVSNLDAPDFDESMDPTQIDDTKFSILRHWKIISIFAVIDTVSSVAAIFPMQYLPSLVLLFMGQLSLPLNLFLSRFVLKMQFEKLHYYAAGVVIVSVIVASYNHSSTNASVSQPMDVIIFWSLWLIIIHLVSSYLAIYRERKMKELNLKPWHTVVWISIIQAPMSVLLIVVTFLPLPKPYEPIAPSAFGDYMTNTFLCLGGKLAGCDDMNLLLFFVFLFFNIISNMAGLILVKLRSSNFVITTGIVNLIFKAIMLTIPPIAGAAFQTLTFMHLVGFVGIILGILIYNFLPAQEYQAVIDPSSSSSSVGKQGLI